MLRLPAAARQHISGPPCLHAGGPLLAASEPWQPPRRLVSIGLAGGRWRRCRDPAASVGLLMLHSMLRAGTARAWGVAGCRAHRNAHADEQHTRHSRTRSLTCQTAWRANALCCSRAVSTRARCTSHPTSEAAAQPPRRTLRGGVDVHTHVGMHSTTNRRAARSLAACSC